MTYIHQLSDWPEFSWDERLVATRLAQARFRQGAVFGKMSALGEEFQLSANVETLIAEVAASSAIEGEILDLELVRSSVALKAGIEAPASNAGRANRDIDGFVNVIWDATTKFNGPLTAARLFHWHRWLFPDSPDLEIGQWRSAATGRMQVVSARKVGTERVHFEAPDAGRVPGEMRAFFAWFEKSPADDLLKAAIAHLCFLTIHPFQDGNGRIARAISELCLARADQSTRRFYSLSAQIERERSDYYLNLELSQKGDLDITDWLVWFLGCFERAILSSGQTLADTLTNARLWNRLQQSTPNARQLKVVQKLISGFDGKLTSSKYAKIAKCSQDTAIRDLKALVEAGVLAASTAGGRSRSYALADEAEG